MSPTDPPSEPGVEDAAARRPRPTPGGVAHPAADGSEAVRDGLPRRWFLAGGAAAVVGGGAGVGAGFLRHESGSASRPAPAALVAAAAAERTLLALAAAAARRDPSLQGVAAAIRADHRAHLDALQSVLAGFDRPRPRPGATPSLAPTPARAQLRAAERAAGTAAAVRAQELTGAPATLLASIAACESTHGELLVG